MLDQTAKNLDLMETFSGIRGIYNQSITELLAYQYAFCFARLFFSQKDVLVIAGDTRPSTLSLKKAMLKALADYGMRKVLDLGIVPVQVAECAIVKFGAKGGVYITASHNEPKYNGWKLLKEDGCILYPEQADRLIASVHNSADYEPIAKDSSLEIIDRNLEATAGYLQYLLEKIGAESQDKIKKAEFKVLADPNGGSALAVLSQLFEELGVTAEIVNQIPGVFNRLIEPKVESLSYLSNKMQTSDFDLAVGFDCDADRMEIVLSPDSVFAQKMGVPNVSGNYVLALTCDSILNGTKGQVVPTNDVTSYLVRDVIKKYQAVTLEVEVGEVNVVTAMEKNNSLIGGEGSNGGEIVFPIKCRDAIMTMVLALKLM
ncbi:MAG: hypothetical protein NTV62_02805, partial [Candidatus Gribaldobacteria bacterium]|nr:hypothetical protein [Candidatus Gribaldobacteria bacterium]